MFLVIQTSSLILSLSEAIHVLFSFNLRAYLMIESKNVEKSVFAALLFIRLQAIICLSHLLYEFKLY